MAEILSNVVDEIFFGPTAEPLRGSILIDASTALVVTSVLSAALVATAERQLLTFTHFNVIRWLWLYFVESF